MPCRTCGSDPHRFGCPENELPPGLGATVVVVLAALWLLALFLPSLVRYLIPGLP